MPQNQNLEERTEDTTNLTGRHLTPLERRGATSTARTNQENPKGFYNGLKRGAAGLLVGIGLMGLAGCATTGNYAAENNMGYEEFFDSRGNYKLVERNNDLYFEKIDGSESRQITHTPSIKEHGAFFGRDNKYILYCEDVPDYFANIRGKYYRINFDGDDSNRKQISLDEFASLIQKHNEKAGTEEEE